MEARGGPETTLTWRPRRRVKHIRSIAGSQLPINCEGKGKASVVVFVPSSSCHSCQEESSSDGPAQPEPTDDLDSQWVPIYCSEACEWPSNPEWAPVDWAGCGLSACALSSERLLIAVYHLLEETAQATAQLVGSQLDGYRARCKCGARQKADDDSQPPERAVAGTTPHQSNGHCQAMETEMQSPCSSGSLLEEGENGSAPSTPDAHSAGDQLDPALAPPHPVSGAIPHFAVLIHKLDDLPSVFLSSDHVFLRPGSLLLELAEGDWRVWHPPPDHSSPAVVTTEAMSPPRMIPKHPVSSRPISAAAGDIIEDVMAPTPEGLSPDKDDGVSVSRRLAAMLISRLLPSASASHLSSGSVTPARDLSPPPRGEESSPVISDAEESTTIKDAASSVSLNAFAKRALDLQRSRARLEELRYLIFSRAAELKHKLEATETVLASRCPAQLTLLRHRAASLSEQIMALQTRTRQKRSDAERTRALLVLQAQTQATALRVMLGAGRRLVAAAETVQGHEGRGQLLESFARLTARRCALAVELGDLFELHPVAVAVPREPAGGYLEERLERGWAGTSAGAASWHTLPRHPSQRCPGLIRREVQLSILGLPLDGKLCHRAFLYDSYDVDPAQDRAASVAVGHAAHLTALLAACLDVPLRYPLVLQGSTSLVLSGYASSRSRHHTSNDDRASTLPQIVMPEQLYERFDHEQLTGEHGTTIMAYPLHCDNDRDRPRFGIALYLLNKDVAQLLQAHGMSAGGPSHLLANIYKLLAAARSAGV